MTYGLPLRRWWRAGACPPPTSSLSKGRLQQQHPPRPAIPPHPPRGTGIPPATPNLHPLPPLPLLALVDGQDGSRASYGGGRPSFPTADARHASSCVPHVVAPLALAGAPQLAQPSPAQPHQIASQPASQPATTLAAVARVADPPHGARRGHVAAVPLRAAGRPSQAGSRLTTASRRERVMGGGGNGRPRCSRRRLHLARARLAGLPRVA